MFITSLIILFVAFIVSTINIKNKYSSVLLMYFVSIAFMMFIGAIYISKITYYKFPLNIDYSIYLNLSTIRVSLVFLARLYNMGFALFMLSCICNAKLILHFNYKKVLVLIFPALIFLVLSDLTVKTVIDLFVYSNEWSLNMEWLPQIVNVICFIIILFYSMLPYYSIVKYYKSAYYIVKKHHIKIYALCITMLNIFFYSIFVFGIFKGIAFYNTNPAGLPVYQTTIKAYISLPILTMIILFIIVALLMLFKPFNIFDSEFSKNKAIIKNTLLLNKNLGMNLHVYKNAFWGANQQFELIKMAAKANDIESIIEYADNGIEMANQQFETITATINKLSADTAALENVNIIECIDTALKKAKVPYNIDIRKDYQTQIIPINGNRQILIETFNNLIMNSIESFADMHDCETPLLSIKVSVIDNTCMIEIADNGCGIPKKDLKKIFKPFYSTKSRVLNSGVGLNFVKMVIKSYHGKIYVISKVGKYTKFQITLPISR